MRKITYELSNLSFDDGDRKNDYLITPKRDEPSYKFTIPYTLTGIRKIYPGEYTKSTCIVSEADPLVRKNDTTTNRLIINI